MTSREENLAPLLIHQASFGVVIGIILLGLVFGTIATLYGSGVLRTRVELAWIASQHPLAAVDGQPLSDETVVTLTRTACYGTCPVYKVTLYGSGRVEFRGNAFVCEKSPPATRVDPMEVRRLVDGLLALGFMAMPSYADHSVTDNPTAYVSLKYGGKTHKVEHYLGDRQAPRFLFMMEDRVDEVTRTSAWLGIDKGWERMCRTTDGKYVPMESGTAGIEIRI